MVVVVVLVVVVTVVAVVVAEQAIHERAAEPRLLDGRFHGYDRLQGQAGILDHVALCHSLCSRPMCPSDLFGNTSVADGDLPAAIFQGPPDGGTPRHFGALPEAITSWDNVVSCMPNNK